VPVALNSVVISGLVSRVLIFNNSWVV